MRLTDTCYRNKRLINSKSGAHPVFLGPVMLHFTKDEATFSRFALELLLSKSSFLRLKTIGVDLEAAITSGFQKVVPLLKKLVCVRHLSKRDEVKLNNLFAKTNMSASRKQKAISQIINPL